jgi:hypothetical protein
MNILANLKSMLADGVNGSVSSKRVVTVICTIMMVVGFVANVFFGLPVDKDIYNSIMWVVVAGVGFTGLEKFGPKG